MKKGYNPINKEYRRVEFIRNIFENSPSIIIGDSNVRIMSRDHIEFEIMLRNGINESKAIREFNNLAARNLIVPSNDNYTINEEAVNKWYSNI